MQMGVLQDFAGTPNANLAILPSVATLVGEELPNCAACGTGLYFATVCSETEDRVCGTCTDCATGKYQVQVSKMYRSYLLVAILLGGRVYLDIG